MTHSLRYLGALIPLVGLFLAGCSQQEAATNEATPAPATSPAGATSATPATTSGAFKVGLISPAKLSDNWGGLANQGVQKVKAELGAETLEPVEEPPLAQVESTMRDAAQQGATVVFCHGSEYDAAASKVAKEFPNTTFVVMGGKTSDTNLIPIQFASGQATYLAGMLAAGMSKTGKIGLVGGDEIPIIKDAFTAFTHGAKAVKPTIDVKTTFTGDGKDIAKAKQQAQSLLDAGADVLMHNANNAGAGVFQAVTDKEGAMVIGANSDESDKATPKNLGSFILDVPAAMLGVAKEIKEGKTNGKPYAAGLKDKAVSFKFNPGFKGTIPQDLKDKMAKAEADMAAGTLDPMK